MCAVQMEEFPVPTYTPLYLDSGGKLSVAASSQSSFNAFVYVGRLGGQERVCPFPRCAFGPVNSPCVCCCHSFESSCVSCAGNRYDPALPVPSIGGNSTSLLALHPVATVSQVVEGALAEYAGVVPVPCESDPPPPPPPPFPPIPSHTIPSFRSSTATLRSTRPVFCGKA